MNEYKIVTDPIELIAGTSNITSPAYVEASKNIDSDNPKKSQDYLKDFLLSIDRVAGRGGVSDPRIVESRGNLSAFRSNEAIKGGLAFLSKNLAGDETVKNLHDIRKALEVNQTSYVTGYDRGIRIICLEYETSVYLLVTGISYTIANNLEIKESKHGIEFKRKMGNSKGVITKTIRDLAKQLNAPKHSTYLRELINVKETPQEGPGMITEPVTENMAIIQGICKSFGALTQLWPTIKRLGKGIYQSMFGILPLIRAILYLHYKRKADTILELERQIHFIQMNIEQLQNMKGMDPNKKALVIQKQQATIDAFRKKAEKLRAVLVETEKDTATALDENKSEVKGGSSSGDDDDGWVI